MKKRQIFLISSLIFLIYLISFISADSINLQLPLGEKFKAGENITIIVSLLDSNNFPMQGNILITIEDSLRRTKVEKEVQANKPESIKLNAEMYSGQGIITANYIGLKTTKIFEIEEKQIAKFEISEGKLIVTNIGNTKYNRKIEITIGTTKGIKTPNLDIGEKASYRLVAPTGVYDISISDGISKPIVIKEVNLIGTGDVIGAIDESAANRAGITGGITPEKESEGEALIEYIQNNKLTYTFILVIFGATILLAIERNYKKKLRR